MKFRPRLRWRVGGRRQSEVCRTDSAQRGVRLLSTPHGRPVDLDRWLELAGSGDDEPPGADSDQVRALQAELLGVLDDPTSSMPPSSTSMSSDEWAELPNERRAALRLVALRRLDPRLVPRTMRHALGRTSSPEH